MGARNGWNFVIALAALTLCATASGQRNVTAGELVVEPPTLISLGFEWYVEGDSDRDAAVAVAYRKRGSGGDENRNNSIMLKHFAGTWKVGGPKARPAHA